MPSQPNIIILGANSLIAPWIVKRLIKKGFTGQCFSRKATNKDGAKNFTWEFFDITLSESFNPKPHSIVISLLPIWLLPPVLPKLQLCQQIISFSTTSIFGKANSPNPEERRLIKKIKAAENDIIRTTSQYKIPWTILRPTLIYDGQNDNNVTAIAKFIKKWKLIPIAKPAKGLRQPVHADDLAAAAVCAIKNPSSYNRSFNLGGGEVLTYLQMVQKISKAIGKPSWILPLPLKLISLICWLIRTTTKANPNTAIFIRMNQNLTYDLKRSRQALNYTPRSFQPDFSLNDQKSKRPHSKI